MGLDGMVTKTFKEYFSKISNCGWGNLNYSFNFIKHPKYLIRMEQINEDYIKIKFKSHNLREVTLAGVFVQVQNQ